jgi:hypothetical protein
MEECVGGHHFFGQYYAGRGVVVKVVNSDFMLV